MNTQNTLGVADPVSVYVETFGTAKIDEDRISELVREHFPLKPLGIIEHLHAVAPPDLQKDSSLRPLRS